MPPPKNGGVRHRGKRMRKIRNARGQTLEQIGEAAGITGQALGKIENGGDMTVRTLDCILVALECSYDDLIAPLDAPAPPRRSVTRPWGKRHEAAA